MDAEGLAFGRGLRFIGSRTLGRTHQQDRNSCRPQDVLCTAAEKQTLRPAPAMGTQNDQIGGPVRGLFRHELMRRSVKVVAQRYPDLVDGPGRLP